MRGGESTASPLLLPPALLFGVLGAAQEPLQPPARRTAEEPLIALAPIEDRAEVKLLATWNLGEAGAVVEFDCESLASLSFGLVEVDVRGVCMTEAEVEEGETAATPSCSSSPRPGPRRKAPSSEGEEVSPSGPMQFAR